MGEDFLANNTLMGDSVKTSQEFLYSHRELDSEKQVYLRHRWFTEMDVLDQCLLLFLHSCCLSTELSIFSLQDLEGTVANALDVSKVRSKTDIAKVQDIQDLWASFSARLEYRLSLGKMYFDFHRHRQLVSIPWKTKMTGVL